MAITLAPDAALVAAEALANQGDLTALIGDRIYTGWPEYQLFPLITLDVIDELELDELQHSARVQVNCWGQGLSPDDEREAALIARTVFKVARSMRGTWPSGRVANSAPVNLVAAPSDGWWRYTVDVLLELYP